MQRLQKKLLIRRQKLLHLAKIYGDRKFIQAEKLIKYFMPLVKKYINKNIPASVLNVKYYIENK